MADTPPAVRRAVPTDLDRLVPLFDAYRRFYGEPSAQDRSREFLAARLAREDSVILIAELGTTSVGFIQLYPMFSSVRCGPLWILNDLFTDPVARGRGVARALMDAAREHAGRTGAVAIELATAHSNLPAQRLYESLGYKRDEEFRVYTLRL